MKTKLVFILIIVVVIAFVTANIYVRSRISQVIYRNAMTFPEENNLPGQIDIGRPDISADLSKIVIEPFTYYDSLNNYSINGRGLCITLSYIDLIRFTFSNLDLTFEQIDIELDSVNYSTGENDKCLAKSISMQLLDFAPKKIKDTNSLFGEEIEFQIAGVARGIEFDFPKAFNKNWISYELQERFSAVDSLEFSIEKMKNINIVDLHYLRVSNPGYEGEISLNINNQPGQGSYLAKTGAISIAIPGGPYKWQNYDNGLAVSLQNLDFELDFESENGLVDIEIPDMLSLGLNASQLHLSGILPGELSSFGLSKADSVNLSIELDNRHLNIAECSFYTSGIKAILEGDITLNRQEVERSVINSGKLILSGLPAGADTLGYMQFFSGSFIKDYENGITVELSGLLGEPSYVISATSGN